MVGSGAWANAPGVPWFAGNSAGKRSWARKGEFEGRVTRIDLEPPAERGYSATMDDTPRAMDAPEDWIDALDESMADIAAGRLVSGEIVRRELLESIARMEAKPPPARKRGAARRR
jgi:hypothetical protein